MARVTTSGGAAACVVVERGGDHIVEAGGERPRLDVERERSAGEHAAMVARAMPAQALQAARAHARGQLLRREAAAQIFERLARHAGDAKAQHQLLRAVARHEPERHRRDDQRDERQAQREIARAEHVVQERQQRIAARQRAVEVEHREDAAA